MNQKGAHTWNMIRTMHRCPSCGFVQESRKDVEKRLRIWQKEIVCPRCKERFIVEGRPYQEPDNAI